MIQHQKCWTYFKPRQKGTRKRIIFFCIGGNIDRKNRFRGKSPRQFSPRRCCTIRARGFFFFKGKKNATKFCTLFNLTQLDLIQAVVNMLSWKEHYWKRRFISSLLGLVETTVAVRDNNKCFSIIFFKRGEDDRRWQPNEAETVTPNKLTFHLLKS